MTREELARIVRGAACRVYGWEDAANGAQRLALASLISAFNYSESTILCEPSLARKTTRPPDVVLVDPEAGVHIVEVKGATLAQVENIEPGGQFRIHYDTRWR